MQEVDANSETLDDTNPLFLLALSKRMQSEAHEDMVSSASGKEEA